MSNYTDEIVLGRKDYILAYLVGALVSIILAGIAFMIAWIITGW